MKVDDVVRLSDGRRGVILATPSGFMSNGSYEVEVDAEKLWVKEDKILYIMDTEFEDDLNNYFEIIYDENGIHMIPKKLDEITLLDENEELKSMEFVLTGEKHKKVTFHIGGTNIWTSDKPKPETEIEDEPKKHRLL
jgi:hypothetical protein